MSIGALLRQAAEEAERARQEKADMLGITKERFAEALTNEGYKRIQPKPLSEHDRFAFRSITEFILPIPPKKISRVTICEVNPDISLPHNLVVEYRQAGFSLRKQRTGLFDYHGNPLNEDAKELQTLLFE